MSPNAESGVTAPEACRFW